MGNSLGMAYLLLSFLQKSGKVFTLHYRLENTIHCFFGRCFQSLGNLEYKHHKSLRSLTQINSKFETGTIYRVAILYRNIALNF